MKTRSLVCLLIVNRKSVRKLLLFEIRRKITLISKWLFEVGKQQNDKKIQQSRSPVDTCMVMQLSIIITTAKCKWMTMVTADTHSVRCVLSGDEQMCLNILPCMQHWTMNCVTNIRFLYESFSHSHSHSHSHLSQHTYACMGAVCCYYSQIVMNSRQLKIYAQHIQFHTQALR